MSSFTYTPDKDTKVHEEGAIKLLCKPFQSHEMGLPEWIKNSSDAYAREDAVKEKRIVIVFFDFGRKNEFASICCLDFVGMTSEMIENNFRIWADPDAAVRGIKSGNIQGGHGNGGKCYMTQMFNEYAFIHTVKKNIGNKYGVTGGSIKFGYIPNPEEGKNFQVANLEDELTKILKSMRCSLNTFPQGVHDALKLANGFSLIMGVNPKGYDNHIPINSLIMNLQEHPQMIKTLEICKVYVVVNGKMFNDGKEISLPIIKPIDNEQPRVIKIPEKLKDPETDNEISTTNNNKFSSGILVLRTSQVNMNYSLKGRHNVIFKGQSGFLGYISVNELDIQSAYRTKIYGDCELDSLEPYKQNDRHYLASSPLTRAITKFISQEIQKYAHDFEDKERRKYNQQEKNAITRMNEALDRWKNKFLKEYMKGMWGGKGPIPPVTPPLPAAKVKFIELDLPYQYSGIGVSFRPRLKFYDKERRRIRPIPFRWIVEDTNIAYVDEDLMVINTFSCGKTHVYAETIEGKIISNKVPLEVVHIHKIEIQPSELTIGLGGRGSLETICWLSESVKISNIALMWTEDNPNIARVSAAGTVFGFALGETRVVAFDDKCMSKEGAEIKVTEGKGSGKGDNTGKGFPRIFISGDFDRDPDTKEYRYFMSDEPPVVQYPQDFGRNIWWINSASPLAKMYLDKNKGYGSNSREWRMYHLERYMDIIVQIALLQSPETPASMSINDWILKWGEQASDIQTAVVVDLDNFIAEGVLPTENP
jgi:23S rRNA-/tRNA-specific pseudouridylate synthase